MSKIGELLKQSGVNFLGGIIQAKQDGEPLPKSLDVIASLALQGKQEAITLAENEVKKQVEIKLGWAIALILFIVIVYLVLNQ